MKELWVRLGDGVPIHGYRLTLLAKDDDKRIIAKNIDELDVTVAQRQANLRGMKQLFEKGESLEVPERYFQYDGGKDLGNRSVERAAWRTQVWKKAFWRTRGLPAQKILALHLSVFPY